MTRNEQYAEYKRMQVTNAAAEEEWLRRTAKEACERVLQGPYRKQNLGDVVVRWLPSVQTARRITLDIDPSIAGTPEGCLIVEIMIRDAIDTARMETSLQ